MLQWVPGHAGIEENGAADRLAAEAAAETQDDVPIDLASARGAIRRHAMSMAHKRAAAAHPHLKPTPGHDSLPRWESVTTSQLRTGRSPLTRDTLERLGLAENSHCPACAEPDSVHHLLVDCPAYANTRGRLWGYTATLEDIFQEPAEKIIKFLRRVGRADPPIDAPPQQVP